MLQNRRIFSALLLAVILPAVLLAPFHRHDSPVKADITCDACQEHLPHQGHLSIPSATDDCLICQLLGQQYFPEEGIRVCCVSATAQSLASAAPLSVNAPVFRLSSPRAPPVSF